MTKRTSASKAFAIAAAAFLLMFALACTGCATKGAEVREFNQTVDLPNTLAVGDVSIAYPEGYEVRERSGFTAFGFGWTSMMQASAIEGNTPVIIDLYDIDDPDKLGLDAVRSAVQADEMSVADMNEIQQSIYAATLGDAKTDPADVRVAGYDAVMQSVEHDGMMVSYFYVADDGAVVAQISLVLPKSTYEADPDLYDSIVGSFKVNG